LSETSLKLTGTEAINARSLHEQYQELDQQREAATLGMWVFLVTEVMFFGGMITGYVAYRFAYPEAFREGSIHMLFMAGTINTAVLITASLFVAFAVHGAREGNRKVLVSCLLISMFLGIVFLAIKGYEYHDHWVEHKVPGINFQWDGPDPRHAELFFVLYFFLTGFHALHMLIGVMLLGVISLFAWKGRYTPEYHNPVENAALYWHFVDIVWIFLYPMLYLIGHQHL
jgi:cytochrome c oxidase subunit 3